MKQTKAVRLSRAGGRVAADLMLVPWVIWMRLPILAAEARSINPWRTETTGAVIEKTAAIAEGMLAAQMSLWLSAAQFWPQVMSGKAPGMLSRRAADHAVHAALKPARKTVRANFRRLRGAQDS